MKNDLRDKLNTALQDVDWNGENQVLWLLRRQQARRPVRTRALVLAIALMLALVTTAVALTLNFSVQFRTQQAARQAVMNKYGLTDEMLDLFTYAEVDAHTATFTMTYAHSDQLGLYTVCSTADGQWTATWSHDNADADLLSSGSLTSPAWGARQLERLLPLYHQQAASWTVVADVGKLSLEELAALDAPLLDIQDAGILIHIVPGQDDLTAEQAQQLARSAIEDKYGVSAQKLSASDVNVSFFLYGGTDRREYRIKLDSYIVYVASPSGAVTHCSWTVQEGKRTLPTGDLSLYPLAAKEYIASGAFQLLSAADKAAAAQRYVEAGLASLLPQTNYVTPLEGDLAENAARQTAEDALEEACCLPAGWKALFTSRTSMVRHENQREWIVEYCPHELDNRYWRDFEKLGVYTVSVDAQSGQVVSLDWSFKGAELSQYTEESFASAPAYSGFMIPWVQALLQDLQVILDKYPHLIYLEDMSLQDRGAYAARMRRAGYSAVQCPDLVPTAKDIPQEEAAALARDALNTMYNLSNLALECGEPMQEGLHMIQRSDGTWVRTWNIVYTNDMDIFTVHINAESGEVENIWHDSPAFGNG